MYVYDKYIYTQIHIVIYFIPCVCNNTHTKGEAMNSSKIIKMLLDDGWYEVAVKGSHHQFKHATKPGRVTVPHPKKDLPQGTVKNIFKQAGLK